MKNIIDYKKDRIVLTDNTIIRFYHEQDCCEQVYADLSALEDTGFIDDTTITIKNLKIEKVEGYGIKLNGYGIPCYNIQNGYYNSHIDIIISHCFDCYEFGESSDYLE